MLWYEKVFSQSWSLQYGGNTLDGTVSVIALDSNSVVTTIPVGVQP